MAETSRPIVPLAQAPYPDARDRPPLPLLRPFAPHLRHPSLWRMTRRSVPRGVALGLFVAVIIPVMHTFDRRAPRDPGARQCRGRGAVHLGRQPADDPAALLCRLPHRLVGASPRRDLVNAAAAERFSSELSRMLFWVHQASGPIALGVLTIAVAAARSRLSDLALVWRFWSAQPLAAAPSAQRLELRSFAGKGMPVVD